MHIPVEIPIAQRVVQEHLQDARGQSAAIMARRIQSVIIADADPFSPIERHQTATRQVPTNIRDIETVIIAGVGREFRGRRAFQPQVQLAHYHAFEMLDYVHWAQSA